MWMTKSCYSTHLYHRFCLIFIQAALDILSRDVYLAVVFGGDDASLVNFSDGYEVYFVVRIADVGPWY